MEVTGLASARYELSDPSQVAEARRLSAAMAGGAGVPDVLREKLALVVTEVAGNVIKHGGGGELVVQVVDAGSGLVVEVFGLDKGRGMIDVGRAMRDGYSTAGTPGEGLGAVQRAVGEGFDLFSVPSLGTVLRARVGGTGSGPKVAGLEVGAISVPKPGEQDCGDAWAAVAHGARATFMIADGLGHGPEAARASRACVAALGEAAANGPEAVLHAGHARLRALRGAAVGVAEIDVAQGRVRFAGIGNVAATLFDGASRKPLVSHNGTLGHELRRVQVFEVPFPLRATLVMASDGIATRWDPVNYPGFFTRAPATAAALLYRDHARGRDDATALVARVGGAA